MIKFSCPHCSQHLEAEDEMAGTSLPCPACQQDIQVPPKNAIRIIAPLAKKKRKWCVRPNSLQLKILWVSIGLLAFFGIFQMHFNGSFFIYDKHARQYGYWTTGYGSYITARKQLVEAPDLEFTPISSKLEDNTVTLIIWLAILTGGFLFLASPICARFLSRPRRSVLAVAFGLFALITGLPVETSDHYWFVSPILSKYYNFGDWIAFYSISGIIIAVIAIATLLTMGRKETKTEKAEQINR